MWQVRKERKLRRRMSIAAINCDTCKHKKVLVNEEPCISCETVEGQFNNYESIITDVFKKSCDEMFSSGFSAMKVCSDALKPISKDEFFIISNPNTKSSEHSSL